MGKRISKKRAQDLINAGLDEEGVRSLDHQIPRPRRAPPLKPQTENQERYLKLIRSKDVVFGLGPAGTGKSYVALAEACQMLSDRKIERIIITRPVVEAGEELGFLPGEMQEKFDPYFAPMRMILNERLGEGHATWCIRNNVIMAKPLAFMRGWTFKDAFVLLDEAQNCTAKQIKLLLTRLGEPIKCVIDGDESQTDLRDGESGLEDAAFRFRDSPRFGTVRFELDDIVRSGLVREVLDGYRDPMIGDVPFMKRR